MKKAIIIDVPIRKFMDERPGNRVSGRAGDPVIEKQDQGALERVGGDREIVRPGDRALTTEIPHPIPPNPGEIRVGQPALSTREGACATRPTEGGLGATQTGAVCTWRRGNGTMCGRPADGGRDECWLHAEWYSVLPAIFGMPYPEDAVAIHQILARTMSMVIGGEISPQKAQAITKLCRELRRNLMWYQREMGMW